MRFLVDAQLPPALARWLTEQGHPSQHVADIELATASDREIWEYAKANRLAIVTKDEDFANISLLDSGPVSVVWIRVPNCTKASMLRWFAPLLPDILVEIERGERVIELV